MFNRIKRITSHSGKARFIAEMTEAEFMHGEIPRQSDIPSPYAYSPTHLVHLYKGKPVIVVETAHKRFDVFAVPEGMAITPINND